MQNQSTHALNLMSLTSPPGQSKNLISDVDCPWFEHGNRYQMEFPTSGVKLNPVSSGSMLRPWNGGITGVTKVAPFFRWVARRLHLFGLFSTCHRSVPVEMSQPHVLRCVRRVQSKAQACPSLPVPSRLVDCASACLRGTVAKSNIDMDIIAPVCCSKPETQARRGCGLEFC